MPKKIVEINSGNPEWDKAVEEVMNNNQQFRDEMELAAGLVTGTMIQRAMTGEDVMPEDFQKMN